MYTDFSCCNAAMGLLRAISQAERLFKPCVNGDFSFLWESQKFDPSQNQNPDLIEIKFGTVNYVGEMTPHAKFHVNLHKGGLLGK